MITLTGRRDIAGCSLFRDDVDELTWYLMPDAPRVALDEDGKPVLSLVQYRRPVDRLSEEERRTRLGGGILTLSVELRAREEQLQQARETLAADPDLHRRLEAGRYRRWWLEEIQRDPARLAAALKLGNVPVSGGTVGITVLGETHEGGAAGEFVAHLVGTGPVSLMGGERAAFMAKLTLDGSVLMWDLLERDLPAIRVGYDLKFNHRLDAVRMVVWCDAEKSFHALQEQEQHLRDNASWSETHSGNSSWYTFSRDESFNARNRLFSVARAAETVRIDIIPEGGPDTLEPGLIAELTKIGNEMVKDFLAATFLEAKLGEGFAAEAEPTLKTELPEVDGKKYGHHGIDFYRLKTWDESMKATLDYQLRTQAVVEGHLAPNDNLSGILGRRRADEFRTRVDIDSAFFKYLDVQVLCSADFELDPVDLVKAHLTYDARGPQGDIHAVKDLVFRKDSPPQHFATYLASPDQRRYAYEYQVFYRGSAESFTVRGETDETVLVLDTDRLGVLRVEVQAGLIDWTRYKQMLVKMWYGRGAERKETEFVLDAQHQSRTWVEAIARPVTEPYGYQVTLVDAANQRLVLDPGSSRSKQLVLNQPLQDEMEVIVIPAGSFGPGGLLSQVVVALRYTDRAHDYVVEDLVALTKEGDSKIWKIALLDKAMRSYEYRVTVFYSDGVTREDEWRTTDKTILAVGDPFGFRVQISPYLLKNPPYAFGTLHLRFDDAAAAIRAEKDLELTDFTKPQTWRFRLGAPDRHTYKYQLTLFKADGSEIRLPEASESREILVLAPPPPQ